MDDRHFSKAGTRKRALTAVGPRTFSATNASCGAVGCADLSPSIIGRIPLPLMPPENNRVAEDQVKCGICGGPVPSHIRREHIEFTLDSMMRMAPRESREWCIKQLWMPLHKDLCSRSDAGAKSISEDDATDAIRYRWLKHTNPSTVCAIAWTNRAACQFSEPDAAIDAAMADQIAHQGEPGA
jgi:hypothetical protein